MGTNAIPKRGHTEEGRVEVKCESSVHRRQRSEGGYVEMDL